MEWYIRLKKKIKMIIFIIVVFVIIYMVVMGFYAKPVSIEPSSSFEIEKTIVE